MKEKLVEEWLIRAGERGGIDQAFGQWLITQGHEILWLGHSSIEFGKDIVSLAPDGSVHAYQLKDEDLSLAELRKITPQINELIDIPTVHPRIPAGSSHVPHLVTSGIAKEEAFHQIRAKNDGLRASGKPEIELIDRRGLITRFVGMSDAFWPEKPAEIRDFFSFYLADGKGDFDHKRFSSVLRGLLPILDESPKRRGQRIAAVGLLGNYLLNPFEREGDHWSLFQGWTLIGSHVAWFAAKAGLSKSKWRSSFDLAKLSAVASLINLSKEALAPGALSPADWEFDDYTRSRNLVVASALAASCLIGKSNRLGGSEVVNLLLGRLVRDNRLFSWGESAVPHILAVQWHTEMHQPGRSAIRQICEIVRALCERNHLYSDDEGFAAPYVSADEILARLFSHNPQPDQQKRGRACWSLEALVQFLARRDCRQFLEEKWPEISKLEMISFFPQAPEDILIWQCDQGREVGTLPEQTQSWAALRQKAKTDKSYELPQVLLEDPCFALMFMLTCPHRVSASLVQFLDGQFGKWGRRAFLDKEFDD